MVQIPEKYLDLFDDKKTLAHLATLMADGSPQASPVWIDRDGDVIVINSAAGRAKDKNMRRDGRVALSLVDPDNPYRAVMIRGRVTDISSEGADDHADRMAKKYLGMSKYPFKKPGEVRVLYRIEVDRVSGMG